jgi:hypothetical protein
LNILLLEAAAAAAVQRLRLQQMAAAVGLVDTELGLLFLLLQEPAIQLPLVVLGREDFHQAHITVATDQTQFFPPLHQRAAAAVVVTPQMALMVDLAVVVQEVVQELPPEMETLQAHLHRKEIMVGLELRL